MFFHLLLVLVYFQRGFPCDSYKYYYKQLWPDMSMLIYAFCRCKKTPYEEMCSNGTVEWGKVTESE